MRGWPGLITSVGMRCMKDLIWKARWRLTERTGYYPESLLGDMIYGVRENRRYLSRLGIKFAGKPLGRPGKVTEANREELKQLKAPAGKSIAAHSDRREIRSR